MASSLSETQNAMRDWLAAGETTRTSAPSTSSPSVLRSSEASTGSGVSTSSFMLTALPRPGARSNGRLAAARAHAQHDYGDVVAQPPVLDLERLALDRLGDRARVATREAGKQRREPLRGERVVGRARLHDPVRVEHEGISGGQQHALLGD